MISFPTDQKIALRLSEKNGIKIPTIPTCRKIFITQQIWKQIDKHVEEIATVLTI